MAAFNSFHHPPGVMFLVASPLIFVCDATEGPGPESRCAAVGTNGPRPIMRSLICYAARLIGASIEEPSYRQRCLFNAQEVQL